MADERELFSKDSYWFQHFLGEIKKKDELSKIYDPFKREQLENFVYSDVRLPLTTGPPTRGRNTGHHKAKEAMSAALVEAKLDPVLFFSSTHWGSCALDVKAQNKTPASKKSASKKTKHKLDDDEDEEKASDAKTGPSTTSDKADAMDSASDAEDESEAEGDGEEETKEKAKGKKKGKDGKGKKRKAAAAKSGRQAKKANKAAPGLKKAVLTAEQENRELRKTNDRLTKQLKEMLGRQIDEGKAKLEKQMAADKQASKDAASVADGVSIGPEPAPSAAPDSADAETKKKEEDSADTKPVEKTGKEGPAKEKPKEQCITCRSWSEDFSRCQSRQHSKEKPAFFCGSPECGGYCSAASCGKPICENCSMQCRGPRLALGVDGAASTGDCVAAEGASGLFCSDDDCINLEKSRCYACIRAEEKLEKEEKSDDEGRGSGAGDGNTNDDDEEAAKADADDGEAAEEEEAAKDADKEKKDSDAEEEEY